MAPQAKQVRTAKIRMILFAPFGGVMTRAFIAELCELLNEEGIPHKTVRREDHLFNLNSKSGFQIGIHFRNSKRRKP